MAVLLENPVRNYAWGSATVIPELLGVEPTGEPQAELWIGAHPGSPSTVVGDGRTLDRYIAADAAGTLGTRVVERFGETLPYLLKVLAIERPLSIQAHPTIEQAEQGYAAEEAAGIPVDSPKRSYRDRNHKPEMVVALTEFDALLGFREPREQIWRLEELEREEFAEPIAMLKRENGVRDLVRTWLSLPESEAAALVGVVTEVAQANPDHRELTIIRRLAEAYPGDRGLLLALLMDQIHLWPGEAAFVDHGVPHAYLAGTVVEVQASSDNTLRAGFTEKHVDIAELERILQYGMDPDHRLRFQNGTRLLRRPREAGPGEWAYTVLDIDEFRLARLDLTETEIRPFGVGPRVVLVVDGHARIGDDEDVLELRRGQAAFVPASEWPMTIAGEGTAYTVTPAL